MKHYKQRLAIRTVQKQRLRLSMAVKYGAGIAVTGLAAFAVLFATGNLGTPKEAKAAVTYYSIANGDWENPAVWSTSANLSSCACFPSTGANTDHIVINHAINMSADIDIESGGSIYISKKGSLVNTDNRLEVKDGQLTVDGTLTLKEIFVLQDGYAVVNGPVTATRRFVVKGEAVYNSLIANLDDDIELKSGSINKAGDRLRMNVPAGKEIINEGTFSFDGNVVTVESGNFNNEGVVTGFGNIAVLAGTILNSGSWDTNVDWCASGDFLSGAPTEPENCLEEVGGGSSPVCDNSYQLDFGDPSTYTVTCGKVNATSWIVQGGTCLYSSPVFNVGGFPGGPNRIADWEVRINQSGNMEGNDSASVNYYVNGSLVRSDGYSGVNTPGVFMSARRLLVPSGGTYQVQVRLKNDKANEMWQVFNGNVTGCLVSIISIPSPLPVTLVDFSCKPVDEKVLLSWTTLAEVNNDYFTIERSSNAYEFIKLGTVNGSGNSTRKHSYTFTDDQPMPGVNYYRLRQTDFDGETTVSKVIRVNISGASNKPSVLKIVPNPFVHSFTTQFEVSEDQHVYVKLYSMGGKVCYAENYMARAGVNHYQFSAPSSLRPAVYNLMIGDEGRVIASTRVLRRHF